MKLQNLRPKVSLRPDSFSMAKTIHVKSVKKSVQAKKLTAEEFTFLAKVLAQDPFESLRFLGKTANFSLLFSASAKTFANSSLNALKPEEAAGMVEQLNLQHLQRQIVSKGMNSEEARDQYFLDRLTLATYIREEFRKAYRGLVKLADDRRDEAVKKGYVRCIHGAVRRLPEMKLKGKHNKGDKELFTLFSIAINSPVQNFESVIVSYYTGVRLWEWLLENDMKSFIFNFVHDSCDLYLHKDETSVVLAKIKELAEERRPEYEGVIPTVSGTVSDYWGKGEIWDEGTSMKEFLN